MARSDGNGLKRLLRQPDTNFFPGLADFTGDPGYPLVNGFCLEQAISRKDCLKTGRRQISLDRGNLCLKLQCLDNQFRLAAVCQEYRRPILAEAL